MKELKTRRCPTCGGKGTATGKNTLSLSGFGICIKCNGDGLVTQAVINEIMDKNRFYF